MDDVMVRIGKNIRFLREQMGLTQSSLANYLNVDQSLISKIENSERSMTSDMLDKLSALFGIAVESLYYEILPSNQISFALRANEIDDNDLETISVINRIALNLNFMTKLLGGYEID